MRKLKRKSSLFMILGLVLLGVGGTLTYFKKSVNFDNVFDSGGYKTVAHEEFTSPTNWMP